MVACMHGVREKERAGTTCAVHALSHYCLTNLPFNFIWKNDNQCSTSRLYNPQTRTGFFARISQPKNQLWNKLPDRQNDDGCAWLLLGHRGCRRPCASPSQRHSRRPQGRLLQQVMPIGGDPGAAGGGCRLQEQQRHRRRPHPPALP